MQLIPAPKNKSLVVLGYQDVYKLGPCSNEIMKFKPIGLEGIDDLLIGYMKKKGLDVEDLPLLPKGNGWLLVEFDGETKEDSDARRQEIDGEFEKKKIRQP